MRNINFSRGNVQINPNLRAALDAMGSSPFRDHVELRRVFYKMIEIENSFARELEKDPYDAYRQKTLAALDVIDVASKCADQRFIKANVMPYINDLLGDRQLELLKSIKDAVSGNNEAYRRRRTFLEGRYDRSQTLDNIAKNLDFTPKIRLSDIPNQVLVKAILGLESGSLELQIEPLRKSEYELIKPSLFKLGVAEIEVQKPSATNCPPYAFKAKLIIDLIDKIIELDLESEHKVRLLLRDYLFECFRDQNLDLSKRISDFSFTSTETLSKRLTFLAPLDNFLNPSGRTQQFGPAFCLMKAIQIGRGSEKFLLGGVEDEF